MSNLTVTNPTDASQTFTFGTKGRKPAWLTDGLANGTIKVPEGYVASKDKVKSDSQTSDKPKSISINDMKRKLDRLVKDAAHANNKHQSALRIANDAKVALDAANKAVEDAKASLKDALKDVIAATADAPATEIAVTPVEVPEVAEIPAT